MKLMDRIDAGQKRYKPTSVAVSTFKKFSEDKSTALAATIAFWGFFSIFPLFLVLVTVLGWVLPASDKAKVLEHVASMFPLLNPKTITGLTGAVWALIVGLGTALWSGMGAVRNVQNAFNSVWEIPYHARPGILEQVRRSLFVLLTIGAGIVGFDPDHRVRNQQFDRGQSRGCGTDRRHRDRNPARCRSVRSRVPDAHRSRDHHA